MGKATLRIPDHLLDELRQRSRDEGRSINAIAVDALRRGLGKGATSQELHDILGPLIAKPATRIYIRGEVQRALAGIPDRARDLWEAFEWARGED